MGKAESGTGYYGFNVPTSPTALDDTVIPTAMGHPRDMCHAWNSVGDWAERNGVCGRSIRRALRNWADTKGLD